VNLFDASALLCFLQGEPGADVVERELSLGGACSAVNWSEVGQKVIAHGADWGLSRSLLLSFELEIEPVIMLDAEQAAKDWRRGTGLSIADRICQATALRLDAHIWTADSAWGTSDRISQVR
jgi:ribonuclease VapC